MKQFGLFLLAYVLVVVFTPFVYIYNLCKREDKIAYTETCGIGFDQAGCAVLYGKENFTISAYTYFLCAFQNVKCRFKVFIDFFGGMNHCKNTYHWEIKKDKKDLEEIC